eukprot:m.100058 g.100058  ORF g.100058 m.100058 type:complete len:556 (+) comp12477_c0_seq1:91-1758(+)
MSVSLPPLTVHGNPGGKGAGRRHPGAKHGTRPDPAGRGAVGSALPPKASGKPAQKEKKKGLPKLPPHLAAKVKNPNYDMDQDTSLTDEEIALLEKWKAAKSASNSAGKNRKRKKKLPPGVAEDLSDLAAPPMTQEELDAHPDRAEIDMRRLLLPAGKVPTGVQNFCVFYCPAVLDGWVQQSSPACAAASTAGAWNALLARTRYEPSAATQDVVVGHMEKIVEDRIAAKRAILMRTIPQSELDYLLDKFSSSMLEDGRTPYMWENGDQSKDMIPRLRRIIMDAGLHLKQISNTMALEDAIRKRKGQFTVKNPSREAEDDANAAVEDGVIDDDGEESESGSSQTPWHHLIQLILTLSGHAKITAERPSTSFFGNDGIYQALKMLQNSNPDVAIHGEPFMGKPKERGANAKGDVEIRVQKRDSKRAIAEQWAALREEFMRFNSVLLFHQTNHYSLIFALREWMDPWGNRKRQVLTAKRGQRPTAWIDFTEVRKILLSWTGYKIIRIVRAKPASFVNDWKVGAVVDVHKGPDRIPTPPDAHIKWDRWDHFIPGKYKEQL